MRPAPSGQRCAQTHVIFMVRQDGQTQCTTFALSQRCSPPLANQIKAAKLSTPAEH